jgi:hypothetical protein
LVEQVDALWSNANTNANNNVSVQSLQPREALIHLIATKIAGEPEIVHVILGELKKHCRIKTSILAAISSSTSKTAKAKSDKKPNVDEQPKYQNYEDFLGHLAYLKDHQVFCRGVNQKVLKMAYDMDGAKWNAQFSIICTSRYLPGTVVVCGNKNNGNFCSKNPSTTLGHDCYDDGVPHDCGDKSAQWPRNEPCRYLKRTCSTPCSRRCVILLALHWPWTRAFKRVSSVPSWIGMENPIMNPVSEFTDSLLRYVPRPRL